jgi:hypothetical protein
MRESKIARLQPGSAREIHLYARERKIVDNSDAAAATKIRRLFRMTIFLVNSSN